MRGAIAGCLVLIAFVAGLIIQRNANRDANNASLPPGVVIDGVTFIESGWNTTAAECPGGFTCGGTVEATTTSGEYLSGCKYYVNPAIPEWVYVYGPVWNERDDAFTAYTRFVLPEIRWNTFIRYDGQVYVRLPGYMSGENDQHGLEDRYGYRIETGTPEGCTLVGSAHMEDADRIPQTQLGVNHRDYDGANVYADPEDSGVLYVGTEWHTATAEEAGDTLHNGYDVFVLYEPGEAY